MPVFRIASTMDPLEKKVRMSGNWLAMRFLHPVHILKTAQVVGVVQLHLHRGGIGSGIGGVERREIRNHADIGNNPLQIPLFNLTRIRSSTLATY